MAGSKKRSMAQTEKAQQEQKTDVKKDKRERKHVDEKSFIVPKLEGKEVSKVFGNMKAITLHRTSKALGINASTAYTLLRNLESKNVIEKRGGFSGHYVWALVS